MTMTLDSADDVAYWAQRDLDAVARAVRDAGTPTEGKLAASIHMAFSSDRTRAPFASLAYRTLGYQPFEGYPLKRLA